MFIPPTADQVLEAARIVGLHLESDEVAVYQQRVAEQLRHHSDFLADRLDESCPPLESPAREPGHRPGPEADPLGAWMWRCEIPGAPSGPLSGCRVGVKDQVSVAGIPQAFNSRSLADYVPEFDATVVTRMLAAGGTICGKNTMSGFLDEYPVPRNPHDHDRTPGGSSSGSAVAVAAGDVEVSIGGDQGGSIRIPAAYCGVVGLKPTFGLVSHFGVTYGFEPTLDHVGPIARRVEDVARTLDVIAGPDGLDPRQGREVPDRVDTTSWLDRGIAGLRVGVLTESFDEPIDPGVAAAVWAAMSVLAAAGAVVERISVPGHRRFDDVYAALAIDGTRAVLDTGPFGTGHQGWYPGATGAAIGGMWREHLDLLPPRIKVNHLAGQLSRKLYGGAVYAKAQNVRRAFRRVYGEALERVDVLVMPTVRAVAPVRDELRDGPVEDRRATLIRDVDEHNWMYTSSAYNTKPLNYTGHPALSVPCGKVLGLPVGMQLVGRHFEDGTLLRTAFAYQSAVDWDDLTALPAGVDR
ncbi:MAG: amidase family protein [Nakamurella sp.]